LIPQFCEYCFLLIDPEKMLKLILDFIITVITENGFTLTKVVSTFHKGNYTIPVKNYIILT